MASFSVTGQPMNERVVAGAEVEEAIDDLVDEPSSDYHVRMVVM